MEFKRKVDRVVNNVSRKAVLNGGFAVEESEGLYAMAECWKTVTGDGCRDCLKKAAYGVRGCSPSREARGLNAGCYLRYSTEKFYNGGETEDNHGSLLLSFLFDIYEQFQTSSGTSEFQLIKIVYQY